MVSQQCLCLDLLCLSRHNLLILHFISVFTQMGYVYWDKKEKNRREDGSLSLIICTDLPLSLVHIITQCAATFTVRVYQILCYFTSVSWYNFQTLQGTAKWCMAIRAVCFLSISPPCPRGLLISFSVAPAFMV